MSDKPKENKAKAIFFCYTDNQWECVYFTPDKKSGTKCKFSMHGSCNSLVAQANRMTLELQKLKGE